MAAELASAHQRMEQALEASTAETKRCLAEVSSQLHTGEATAGARASSGAAAAAGAAAGAATGAATGAAAAGEVTAAVATGSKPAAEAPPPKPMAGLKLASLALAAKKVDEGSIAASAMLKGERAKSRVKKPLEPQDATRGVCSRNQVRSATAPSAPAKAKAAAAALAPIKRIELAAASAGSDSAALGGAESPGGWHGQLPLPEGLVAPGSSPKGAPPDVLLGELLGGLAVDLERAKAAAQRMRDPAYTLRMYHEDCVAAFPELRLYLDRRAEATEGVGVSTAGAAGAAGGKQATSSGGTPAATSSGLSSMDEYLRTIGALFALYWLVRIGIDGERSFTFGVDEAWQLLGTAPSAAGARVPVVAPSAFFSLTDEQKRQQFLECTAWAKLLELLCNTGCLRRRVESDEEEEDDRKANEAAAAGVAVDEFEVDEDRMLAMLVLTAIHDIMKIEALLPTVQSAHAPYNGFAASDQIHDHDIALGYVLDHFGHCLPSYAALAPEQQRVIRFTQAKLGFNHGWYAGQQVSIERWRVRDLRAPIHPKRLPHACRMPHAIRANHVPSSIPRCAGSCRPRRRRARSSAASRPCWPQTTSTRRTSPSTLYTG